MQIVVGLSLNNLKPRVWDAESPYYLDSVQAVMVSYAEFDKKPSHRSKAMKVGLHAFLGVPDHISIYLDNGSFNFHKRGQEVEVDKYEQFVEKTNPAWYVVPQDYIPTPSMSKKKQRAFAIGFGRR